MTEDQDSLFGVPPAAPVDVEPNKGWAKRPAPGPDRSDNSGESRAAGKSVRGLTEKQNAVLAAVAEGQRLGEDTDEGIASVYASLRTVYGWPEQSDSGLRTRRSELVTLGKVERAGTGHTSTGRSCATWRVI